MFFVRVFAFLTKYLASSKKNYTILLFFEYIFVFYLLSWLVSA